MVEPSPSRPITLAIRTSQRHAHRRRQAVSESAARACVKGVALDHGQIIVHGAAAAGSFLDDDAVCRTERGDLLHEIAVTQVIRRQARRAGRDGRRRASRGRLQREKSGNTELQIRDNRGADGTPRRRAGVIGELHQRGAFRDMGSITLDVIGKNRRTQRKDQIRALQALDDPAPGPPAEIRRTTGDFPGNYCARTWGSPRPPRGAAPPTRWFPPQASSRATEAPTTITGRPRIAQRLGGGFQQIGIACHPPADLARHRSRARSIPVVHGNRDEGGAARAAALAA